MITLALFGLFGYVFCTPSALSLVATEDPIPAMHDLDHPNSLTSRKLVKRLDECEGSSKVICSSKPPPPKPMTLKYVNHQHVFLGQLAVLKTQIAVSTKAHRISVAVPQIKHVVKAAKSVARSNEISEEERLSS